MILIEDAGSFKAGEVFYVHGIRLTKGKRQKICLKGSTPQAQLAIGWGGMWFENFSRLAPLAECIGDMSD